MPSCETWPVKKRLFDQAWGKWCKDDDADDDVDDDFDQLI